MFSKSPVLLLLLTAVSVAIVQTTADHVTLQIQLRLSGECTREVFPPLCCCSHFKLLDDVVQLLMESCPSAPVVGYQCHQWWLATVQLSMPPHVLSAPAVTTEGGVMFLWARTSESEQVSKVFIWQWIRIDELRSNTMTLSFAFLWKTLSQLKSRGEQGYNTCSQGWL